MLRRSFPKGTNFSKINDIDIQSVVNLINNMPRKVLKWKSAAEVLLDEIKKQESGFYIKLDTNWEIYKKQVLNIKD